MSACATWRQVVFVIVLVFVFMFVFVCCIRIDKKLPDLAWVLVLPGGRLAASRPSSIQLLAAASLLELFSQNLTHFRGHTDYVVLCSELVHRGERRCVSWRYSSKNTICRNTVWKNTRLKDFRKYITSRGLRTLCNNPETPKQLKSESVTGGPTDSPGYVLEMLTHLINSQSSEDS